MNSHFQRKKTMMKSCIIGARRGFSALLLSTIPWAPLIVVSGEPYLVKDINTNQVASAMSALWPAQDWIFFTAWGNDGIGLWVSDGTTESTLFVAATDIFEGQAVGRRLFFVGTGEHGEAILWVTDGTPQGTILLLHDFSPDWFCSGTTFLQIPGGVLFLNRTVETKRLEPWFSDGTSERTKPIRGFLGLPLTWIPDIAYPLGPFHLTIGERFLLIASDPEHGRELWISDFTHEGTQVLDVNPGPDDGDPLVHTVIGSLVFFSAHDLDNGQELWVSDGTVEGTQVLDVNPGPGSGDPSSPIVIGRRAFFGAYDRDHGREVRVSDGTADGTQVLDVNPGPGSSDPYSLTILGQRIFFTAYDRDHGRELWVSDGTEEGTRVIDAVPGAAGLNSYTISLAEGQIVFFPGGGDCDDPISCPRGLWVSDGTITGTKHVTGPYGSINRQFLAAGKLYFTVMDGQFQERELWATDGSLEGTIFVSDNINGAEVYTVGDRLVWFGQRDTELWATDGISQAIRLLQGSIGFSEDGSPCQFRSAMLEEWFFFVWRDDEHGLELWETDGTSEGTGIVHDISPGPEGAFRCSEHLVPCGSTIVALPNGTLFFEANDGTHGVELWAWRVDTREDGSRFHRGDPNGNGTTDISDGIAIFGFLFLGNPTSLPCKESADSNNDGTIDISDGIAVLNWLFIGGRAPAAPGPTGMPCGFDHDPPGSLGDLGCETYNCD